MSLVPDSVLLENKGLDTRMKYDYAPFNEETCRYNQPQFGDMPCCENKITNF